MATNNVIGNNYAEPSYGPGAQTFGPLAAYLQAKQDTYDESARQYQDKLAEQQAAMELANKQKTADAYAQQVEMMKQAKLAAAQKAAQTGLLTDQQVAYPALGAIGGVSAPSEANAAYQQMVQNGAIPQSVANILSNPDGSLNPQRLAGFMQNANMTTQAAKIAANRETVAGNLSNTQAKGQNALQNTALSNQGKLAVADLTGRYRLSAAQIAQAGSKERQNIKLAFQQQYLSSDKTLAAYNNARRQISQTLSQGGLTQEQQQALLQQYEQYGKSANELITQLASKQASQTTSQMTLDENTGLPTTTNTKVPVGTVANAPAVAPTGAPAVGTVRGRFRFKGGNPNDKKNWEIIK